MNNKKMLIGLALMSACVLMVSCGRKKVLSPEEEARLNARDAIVRAEKIIEICDKEEVPVAVSKLLFEEAGKAMGDNDYLKAKEKADAAYTIAKAKLDETLAARKQAMDEAAKEFNSELPSSYTVRSWAQTKDCLWNISKKQDIYNDPWQWKKIYIANRAKIKDPDVIYKGQILKIPR